MIPLYYHNNPSHIFLGTFLEKNDKNQKYWDLYVDGYGKESKIIARYGNQERDWESMMISMIMDNDFGYYPFKIGKEILLKRQ